MNDVKQYIESGILELYVLGLCDHEETQKIQLLAEKHTEIKKEIELIENALKKYAEKENAAPHPALKTLLMATIDYTERLKNGEAPSFPAELNASSTITDYSEWLNRKDMVAPENADEIFAKIIGHTEKMTTVIVWIKDHVPYETHDAHFEKFLILEGTCEIIMQKKTVALKAGDYYSVPLHSTHMVKVTSATPCKAIVQRVAA
jgi:mannose-6-phosphate isomerase-like protein (cupin superfamily)